MASGEEKRDECEGKDNNGTEDGINETLQKLRDMTSEKMNVYVAKYKMTLSISLTR